MPAAPTSQIARISPPSSRSRRWSRATTAVATCRAAERSSPAAAPARTNASPNSCSSIDLRLLQDAPECPLGVIEPRLHRADAAAGDGRDLLVGQALKEPQHQGLAVFERQAVQGVVDARGVLGGEFDRLDA